MTPTFKLSRITLALTGAFLLGGQVLAQTVQPPAAPATAPAQQTDANKDDQLKLDSVVVTGAAVATTKMRQSLSVSTLSNEQIEKSVATNAAEVLRSVPGVRSESSAGEGNTNITMRGAPLSAGGSRYVSLQEDGLPVLLFGDIAFATPDQYLRADAMIDRLEVVRGGSASTLASNGPAGIINFISKTGEDKGGMASLGVGLDFRQYRLEFTQGGKASDTVRYQVGGFWRVGEASGRNANFNAENGGQIKGNVTFMLGGNNYIRASLKVLNDKTPTFLPVPTRLSADGRSIQTIPGIDPRNAFFVTNAFNRDVVLDRNNQQVVTDPRDGLHMKSTALGLEAGFDLGSIRIENRFRYADNGGRFIGVFPASDGPAVPASVGGPLPADRFVGHIFNTSLDSLDNVFNDLKASYKISLGGKDSLTVTGGLFYGKQDIAQTWYWNGYVFALNGDNPRNFGQLGTLPTPIWGNFIRSWDSSYTQTAPYAALTWDAGALTVDASLRSDRNKGSGYQLPDGYTAATGGFDTRTRNNFNYSISKTSYSVGANYQLDRNLAAFARVSSGVSFMGDRVLGAATARTAIPFNELTQQELGVKIRSGGLSAFITAFNAKTKEGCAFEASTQRTLCDNYSARGVEAELGLRAGAFRLTSGVTLTDASIDGGPNNGKTPRRQADVVYSIAPSYSVGNAEIGAAIIGTTKSYAQNDNVVVLPGYTVVNAFLNYSISDNLLLNVGVNNLFNKLGYTEGEGQNGFFVARSINGRTARATIKYLF
ncbi:TonB-dependent siderophore receptor [Piscinibacterium candidicorallinum]|uniref:TonB-dependent siderophore receptor n=1 Tax=Piscinibacterium candidicorallinum TaxID=1793872 RepID=A0ABV7H606_9BURK